MDPAPSGIESQSTKTKMSRIKSKRLKVIEKSLSMDDSFTQLINKENISDDLASAHSKQDQMGSESQTAGAAYFSCSSNDNAYLTQSSVGSVFDGISGDSGSCSSFAAKSRSGRNVKRMSSHKKNKYEKVVLSTLGDSLLLNDDIPEEEEILTQKPENQELTRNPTETKADVLDAWKSSGSKARSGIKKEIVAAPVDSELRSEEMGKRNALFSLKRDMLNEAAKDRILKSLNYSSKAEDLSEIERVPTLDSKTLLHGKKKVVKKSATDVGAACGSPDVMPSSQCVMERSSMLSRPFGCFGQKLVPFSSNDVSLHSTEVSLASKNVSLDSKGGSLPSKDVSSSSKGFSLPSKDVSLPSKDVSLPSKEFPSASGAIEPDTFSLSRVSRIVRYVVMQDVSVQTDLPDSSAVVGKSFTDASIQSDFCNCPRLLGFHGSSNVSTSSLQNLSRSERNRESNKFLISGGDLSKSGEGSECFVPASPEMIYGRAKETNKMVSSHPEDVAGNGVKAIKESICCTDEAVSDTLSQMFSRVGLSDRLKQLPDKSARPSKRKAIGKEDAVVCDVPQAYKEELLKTDNCGLDSRYDSAYIANELLADNMTAESKALNESTERDVVVSPERLNISLQVSFASDESLVDEIAAAVSNDVLNVGGDSDAGNASNETIIYITDDVPDAEKTDNSLSCDEAEKSIDGAGRSPAHFIKTEPVEWDGSESLADDDPESEERSRSELADGDSWIRDPKTDFRSICLQISFSDESVVSHLDDKSSSLLRDPNDLSSPGSPLLWATAAASPSSAAEDGEQMKKTNERQMTVSINTPSEPSLTRSLHNVSLQVSISSDDDTPTDDLKMIKDDDRKDHDQKPLQPQLPRNSDCGILFDMSDEEQSLGTSPDVCDVANHSDHHRLSEVPLKNLCSTFLDRPSLESARKADGTWALSPIETENQSPNRRKSKSVRRVSMRVSNKDEKSIESYMSANGSLLVVPDSSESSDEQGAFYKTANVECDAEEVSVADSIESQVDKSREEHANDEVISVSDSLSSDDDDFESFLERVKSSGKINRFSPPSLDDFIVDDCEVEEERYDKGDEEYEDCDDDDDDDVIIDDNECDDDRVFYYQVDNEREQDNVDSLSNRLDKVLDFNLSDSSDDDFQVLPKRKDVTKKTKKSGKATTTFPLEDGTQIQERVNPDCDEANAAATDKENAAGTFRIPAPEDAGIFRAPAPVVSKRRILSIMTPKASLNSVFCDKRQVPYTVGCVPPPRYTFLKSLSADVKELLRDAKAARYVKNFKSLRDELTAELFALFNKEVFDLKIPSDMNVIWNDRLRRTAGFCRSRQTRDNPPKRLAQIELSVKVCDSADRLRDTLIHEMCHAVVWLEHGSREVHGPIWKFWAMKANRLLPDLPLITRCHSYDINTKYIYKCAKCGYEIGRHSKSLDTEKKICGHCRGQFELLVRPRNGSRPDSVPTTPRTPNKFALFVKENYGDIKKTQPGIAHKEIMEMIGARYSAKKAALGGE